MASQSLTPGEYIKALPEERQTAVSALRNVILQNLPKGFEEITSSGMIAYVVPHAVYPDGYHTDKTKPLPFISIASQKNFIALYHMGLYADKALLKWFTDEYGKRNQKKTGYGQELYPFQKTGRNTTGCYR